jgi:hypothetical protein
MKKSVKYGLYFVVGLVAVLLLASIVYFLLLFPAFDCNAVDVSVHIWLLPVDETVH